MWAAARGHSGLSLSLFSCFVALLPCAVIDGWRMGLLGAIWAVGHGRRLYHGDRQTTTDCFVFGIVYSWLEREVLFDIAVKRWKELDLLDVVGGSSTQRLTLCSTIAFALISLLSWRGHGSSEKSADSLPSDAHKWSLEHPRPRIFPCRTTHARMFPEKHDFGYSYLQCGYPIIPFATTATGRDITDGRDRGLGSWWLRVKADDYLARGHGNLGFYNKLKLYLKERVCEIQDDILIIGWIVIG